LAVAETLVANGLTNFYRYREQPSNRPEVLIPQEIIELEALDNPDIVNSISDINPEQQRKIELGIEGITCSACGWLIEKTIAKLSSVISISVNIATQRATLIWCKDEPLSEILKAIHALGYRAYPFSEDERERSFSRVNQNYTKRLLVAGLGMMQVMTYALTIYIGEFQDLEKEHQTFLFWISGLIATPVVFYSAKPFFVSAINGLKVANFGMNLPVSIAIIAAYSASVYSLLFDGQAFYFDSVVMFTFFLLIGRFFEHRARYQSILKQQNFKQLIPHSVSLLKSDKQVESVAITNVQTGDQLVIHSGSLIPVDGVLLDESATLNESVLTGEFLPVTKYRGDKLVSGSTNNSATFVMEVSKCLADSHLQQLVQLQQLSEENKPAFLTLADKVAHWYILVLFSVLVVVGIYWWNTDIDRVFPIVLSVLVVSCPCALSLATPTAMATATAQLSELGLMIRNQDTLAKLAKLNKVYFDKTGTLTSGVMTLEKTEIHTSMSHADCLLAAQALEAISNHPIASAFARAGNQKNSNSINITSREEVTGQGVRGQIGKCRYFLGNQEFVNRCSGKKLIASRTENFKGAQTVLYLANEKQWLATFTLTDQLRQNAKLLVCYLKKRRIKVSLLSGDSEAAVSAVAKTLGISEVIAQASSQQKLLEIQESEKNGQRCLMLGDGFNDLGALSNASASITMGSGVDLSRASSDAVLLSSNLGVIAATFAIAKKAESIIKQNLSWAFIYNILAIPFAAAGWVPAWLAAIGMSSSSLIVVLNALRLRRANKLT
jgi:Cu2+-exporting ATPase